MARSSSDYSLFFSEDANELARQWAQHKFNAPTDPEFASYAYTLLLNGRNEDNDPCEEDEPCNPETGKSWYHDERILLRKLVDVRYAELVEAARLENEPARKR